MNSHVPSNRNQSSWTDEKHGNFLNSMEEYFVRTMLHNNHRYNLRLDRQLPDNSESTLDCKHHNVHQTRKKHASSVDCIGTTRSKMKVRSDKRSRRPPLQSEPQDSSSSQDQVVPLSETVTRDEDEKRSFQQTTK